jgi:hypothetical protein
MYLTYIFVEPAKLLGEMGAVNVNYMLIDLYLPCVLNPPSVVQLLYTFRSYKFSSLLYILYSFTLQVVVICSIWDRMC